jgi:glutathione peroxidase
MKTSFILALLALTTSTFAATKPTGIHAYTVNSLAGPAVALSNYQGKAMLIVNTASQCGYTPQYEGLQALYQKYQSQGLEVLGFPSNDFGSQEPGDAKEIRKFCDTRFHVTFPLFEKGVVSGSQKQPLYDWLVHNEPGAKKDAVSEVSWNFEKFVVARNGKIVARFKSSTKPESAELIKAIEEALKK